jgi:hypothetical protein
MLREDTILPAMSSEGLYGCRFDPDLRWGQKVVDTFGLHGNDADRLFYADDKTTAAIIEQMIVMYQLS